MLVARKERVRGREEGQNNNTHRAISAMRKDEVGIPRGMLAATMGEGGCHGACIMCRLLCITVHTAMPHKACDV